MGRRVKGLGRLRLEGPASRKIFFDPAEQCRKRAVFDLTLMLQLRQLCDGLAPPYSLAPVCPPLQIDRNRTQCRSDEGTADPGKCGWKRQTRHKAGLPVNEPEA